MRDRMILMGLTGLLVASALIAGCKHGGSTAAGAGFGSQSVVTLKGASH